ncbi:non-ribosomal peptide synthetase [Fusarium albosuccineum]|uniref:Non-ribosomal peptide synthetase n=1 Tax=Fusarium albosuccineum TaxID=1237068 RepID=A0A8H4KYU4_9HYPO|nr:non-ribosomal peptide synthetase [Fusarium albosuccineum]
MLTSDLKNQVAVIERPALASSGSESESTGSVTPPVVERNLSHDKALVEYWKSALSDLNTTPFPSVPQDLQVVLPDQATKHRLTALGAISGAAPESIVCAAWALAVGPMIGAQDVVLGIAMSGGSPSGGVDSITTVPFRLLWSKDQRVDAFLQSVQRRVSELSQTGLASLAEIAQTCLEARQACEFQTVLTVGNSHRLFVQKNRYPMELDLHLENGEYVIEAAFNSQVVPASLVERLLARVDLVVHQLGADTHRTLDAINSMTENDLRNIWNWNRGVPATIERCVHSLIEDQVDANPDAPAICSWDGDLTYAELDDRADQLANRLVTAGLRPGDVVALCFTKSMWANVAMLGALKAGGTLVMLDPALPEQRLQSMTNQVGARLLISSLENKELGSRLCKITLVVGADGFEDHGAMTRKRVQLDPSSMAYIQFTSGSTGVPKGAAISHQSMSSGIHHQLRRLDLGRDTRLYDFSTYSFDMALYNAFFALSSGGCLCVPSESGRKDDLAGSIRNTGANTLLMTPSTAQTIRPDDVPAVNKVLFGGEAVHERDAAAWWGQAKVLNMYGPCECTPCSIIGDDLDYPAQAVYIGRGCGANTWVVDPEDQERLVPPGCVGELLLEGPLVTAGYLNDAERNSRAYAVDPPWIVQGAPGITGRRARLYKTGDLVRYTENGALAFVSRKDTQVKIRGQRIELGEVEYRVHQSMPQFSQVAAEVVKPINSNPMLIAFLVDENAKLDTVELYEPPGDFGATIAENLPTYMIPSVYLSISKMPLTATEKINRKRLREIGATLLPQKLSEMAASGESKEQPSSDTERHMQRIWAEVLNFQDCTAIGTQDSFFRLGGDSIAAMRVVRALKDVGLHLSVSLVLEHPTLRDMAAQAVGATGMIAQSISRFSLLPSGCDVETVLRPYGLDALQVEGVFPCTSLQEGLVSLSSQRSGDYVTQAVLKLSSDTSVGRFRGAWKDVTQAIPLLRTRFVQGDSGLLQVVVEEPVQWQQADDLKAYLESDRKRPMELGQTFTRCALISDGDNGRVTDFVLTAHHALHDGWSMGLAMDALNRAYGGEGLNPLPPFQRFIQYTQHQNYEEASEFWKKRLQNCESVPYPILPASVDKPSADSMISCALPNPSRGVEFTTTTIIRAAWALVAGCMVNSDDVVYGGVVSGRSAEVADIDRIPGPTIATVPLRFHLDKSQTIASFLKTVQQQATDMIPYEQMGLLRIAQLSTDCEQACGFQTLLVIQPETVDDGSSLGRFEEQNAMQWSSTYGLVLVVQLAQSQSSISASFDSMLIDSAAVQSLLDRLGFVIGQLSCTNIDPGMCLEDISTLTPSDFDTLWAWNKAVPKRIGMCIHEVVHRQAVKAPDQIAVCAWDGELTYGELDRLSTKLAGHLSINKEEVVPLCFQKTVLTPVAVLAVLKAGGTFLLLDPALPQARLEVIVESVDANIILSTRECAQLSSTLVQNLITVDAALLSDLADTSIPTISDSSSAAYIIFTSGSTGTPKGVVITHSNVVSAVTQHCRVLEYTETSRIFDFSSYSFGASLSNMLCALTSGACLCVPSDEDRRSDLAASITRLRATDVLLTPSMAEHLSPSSVPTLRSLILGGEAVRAQDAGQWLGRVKLRTAYGQSEGTTIATINPSPTTPEETTRIGHGVGTVTWVVDPENHENLLPPGAIGELLIEGPAVGRGYFRDEEKAAEVFIRDPSWLLSVGRRGKLYKTGDLVRYNSDTTLSYVGRKDSQVKIRGQRIELGDVEYWVRELMPEADKVAVEAITPSGPGGRPTLAAFIQMSSTENSDTPNLIRVDGGVIQLLKQQELRNLGSSFSVQDIAAVQPLDDVSNRPPVTDRERRMQGIWSQVLNRPREEISLNSSFFHLGGDSINAMKVASAARQAGLDITVANIFQYRTLRLIADRARYVSTEEASVAPFTLVNGDADVAKEVARSCGVGVEIIEDAYPCAPLQEGLMSLASRRPGDYMMQASLELSDAVDITAFRRAWETVHSVTAVLRTRFVQHDKLGLLQAVLGTSIDWHETTGLDEYLSSDRKNHINLSTPLVRFALVKDHAGQTRRFVLTMHHALYDGWSLPLLLNMVDNAYRGGRLHKETAFSSFIHYITKQTDDIKTTEYWQTTLQGYESAPFPTLPTSIDWPVSDTVVHHRVTRLKDSRFDVTPSILARAAWGIVLARTVNTEETVFGVTVSGRNAPVAGIDKMAAPAFATVPLRVHTEPGQKVSDYIETMQQQATDMIPYEQTGMQHIAKVSPGARQACEFQTLLVVQQGDTSLEETELGCWINRNQTEFFNPYALMVEVGLLESGDMALKASFDSRVISHWMVERLLNQFSFVVKQLQRARPRQILGEIDTMTESDIQEIWAGKHVVPESVANVCIHELVRRRAEMHPHKQAICAWDGDFSYMELDQLSSVLSRRLIHAGVYLGQLIPLCFQKSKWTPVAILAVLKAGGAFVLLDPSLPEERLKAIAGQLDSDLILSSVSEEQLSSRLVHRVIRVGPELLNDAPPDFHSIPRQSATTTMFVIFTSGSTGVPKGVMMTHVNFASGLYHQLQPLGFNETSRVFDFASYAFDIAVHNVFAALVSGGCLCIPSEESRRGNIGKAMVDMHVTIADITPSVGRLLDPESLPELETIIIAGEDLTAADSIRWSGYARVINAYGPAETGIATVNPDASNGRTHIGPGYGVNCWVVDPSNHNRLVTPGSTGELLLEGPIVSSGYLNDPKKTASSFIQDPPWLLQGPAGRSGKLYKTGDLVQCGQHGDLVFLGRKDDQVKIRGQRVELGEVEHWVRHSFSHAEQVAAEVITPRGENVKSTLVAFVQSITDRGVLAVSPGVREELAQNLPSYMLPSAFVALKELPMTTTGKINRKELRKIGATFSTDQLIEKDDTTAIVKEQPATETERRMQSIWCSIFDLVPSQIGLDDSFFRLGGDSIIAMKLVGEAYKVGVDMSVADVFKYRTLRNISRHSKMSGEKTSQRIEPFSLMASDTDVGEIAVEIKTDPSNIRDIYPCTPLQEGLVSLGLKRAGDCVAQATLEISPDVDMAAFCHAWEEVVRVIDILRTRIVQHERLGLVQVVLGPETPFTWKKASDLEDYQWTDRAEHMAIPGPLTRYALVKSPDSEKRWFVWTIHHALYDGWSVPLLLRAVEKAYLGERVPPGTQFQAFIQHLQQTDETVSKGYWQDTLEGCDSILFPSLPPRYDQPMADSFITYRMPCPSSPEITTSTMIRAAWALVLADTTASSDVVFGTTVSGRNAPVHGINAEQAKWFGMYPLTLNMQLGDDAVAISAVSDSRTVKPWLVRKLLERLEFVTRELSNAGPETMLYEIASMTPEDLDDVWSWNDSSTRRWVVDEASRCLVPPGCVGELLLETSNDGNLDELNISETEIVQNAPWLEKGSARYPGRQGTLYKTGDLVHHNERGELIYIARRRDALVKLQGQRINLNTVESRVTHLVPDAKKAVVVHVPVEHEGLVAFVQIEGTQSTTSLDVPTAIKEDLATHFPSSSMPKTFLAIGHIPLTSTGHPNREQLRQMAISFFSHQAAQQNVSESLPKTHVELQLRKIWAHVLSIEPNTISLHNDFFHMGGDSVAAIKVASESKKVGITLTVADMFRYPTLAEAARAVLNQNGASSIKNISPFALLGEEKMDVQQTISEIASKIGMDVDAIQDAYPCTPLQAGLMSLSSKRAGAFVLQATLELDANCKMSVFKEAWEAAYNALPILRTRIIHSDLCQLLQVVTNESLRWIESSVPLKEYLHLDQNKTMDLGQPLSRYALVREGGKPKYFVWTIHHALYDGWSMGLILNMINDAFHGQITSQDRSQFQHFIKYLDNKDEKAEASYWREYLEGYDSAPYPELPRSIMEQPAADSTIERSVKHLSGSHAGILASTVVHASWALVAGGMAGSDDVVFGMTLSGRNVLWH